MSTGEWAERRIYNNEWFKSRARSSVDCRLWWWVEQRTVFTCTRFASEQALTAGAFGNWPEPDHNRAELLDLQSWTWTETTPYPAFSINFAQILFVNERFYVIGGLGKSILLAETASTPDIVQFNPFSQVSILTKVYLNEIWTRLYTHEKWRVDQNGWTDWAATCTWGDNRVG